MDALEVSPPVAVVDVKMRMVGGCTLVFFTTLFSSRNKIVGKEAWCLEWESGHT